MRSLSSAAPLLTLLNLNSPFLVVCWGQWEDSCFVSLHWLIYISTASLSKWPLSVVTYENYRGHWGPFSFDRLGHTHTHTHDTPSAILFIQILHRCSASRPLLLSVPLSEHPETAGKKGIEGWRDGGRGRSSRNKGEASICTPIVFPSL